MEKKLISKIKLLNLVNNKKNCSTIEMLVQSWTFKTFNFSFKISKKSHKTYLYFFFKYEPRIFLGWSVKSNFRHISNFLHRNLAKHSQNLPKIPEFKVIRPWLSDINFNSDLGRLTWHCLISSRLINVLTFKP